jgi:hypothetical protein
VLLGECAQIGTWNPKKLPFPAGKQLFTVLVVKFHISLRGLTGQNPPEFGTKDEHGLIWPCSGLEFEELEGCHEHERSNLRVDGSQCC